MHLYRSTGVFIICPVHKYEAHRYGRRVQGEEITVDTRQELRVFRIQWLDKAYQVCTEIGISVNPCSRWPGKAWNGPRAGLSPNGTIGSCGPQDSIILPKM